MAAHQTTPALLPSTTSPRRAGLVCLVGGLVGAAQAAVMLVAPASVGSERYSYPFEPTGYTIAQTTFFLQHLLLIPGLWALFRVPMMRASRAARAAGTTAVLGMALLAVQELVAISAAHESMTSDRAQLVNNLYGVPVILLAVALVTGGVVALRTPRDSWADARWLPLLVLATGGYVFVPLTPALAGTFVAGRLGIGGWMLLFAALGYGLTRLRERV